MAELQAYFEEAKLFYDNEWTFNTTQWKEDWYAMMEQATKMHQQTLLPIFTIRSHTLM